MRIAIDAMGGDFAPKPIVEGALYALAADPNLQMTLVGDRQQVEPLVKESGADESRIAYDHTTEVVGMEESPAKALRGKPNSSINRCWSLLAAGEADAIVSAGNTGAVVAGGLRTRRFLGNIQRPGIAVTVPSPTGKSVMLDVGANVAPKPEHLYHYGLMGTVYARQVLGIEKPTIGLLNVGSEEMKGNDLAKQTAALFNKSSVRDQFKGNIEGRDICRGMVDVIVCDGFVGNIVLKCCEGLIEFLLRAVQHEVLGSLSTERDLALRSLMGLHSKHHHSEVGGAPLLGIDGVCLICHGGSDAKAIKNAVRQVGQFTEVNRLIAHEATAPAK
jgi:glycerol-3-phosphate acyltransferase PlsX